MGDHIACQFPAEAVVALVEDGVGVGSALGCPDRGASAESPTCSASPCTPCPSSLSNEGNLSLEEMGEAGDEARELLLGLDMDMELAEERGALGMSRILVNPKTSQCCATGW